MESSLFDQHDALGLAELVRNGQCSPGELLDEALRRTELLNPKLNAIVVRLDDLAKDQLDNLPNGPFRGVPFLLKDLYVSLAGAPLSNGSKAFRDQVPTHDSYITERYRRAGLVIFGRSASPEFGLTTTTESQLFGATRNPWNLTHTSGGSSGGASSAVAAGILPAAHASDGGGSIRIPASCCGLFGLKPSRGLVSMAPEAAEGWGGMSCHHAITRSVRDSAALLDAVAGNTAGDPYSAPHFPSTFLSATKRPPHSLRIALTTTPFTDVDSHPECVQAAETAAELCRELGHEVVEARPEVDAEALSRAARVVVATNTAAALHKRGNELGRPLKADDVEPITWGNAQTAQRFSALDYLSAIETVHDTGRKVGNFLERFDVLLSPTMPAPPQPIGALALDHQNPQEYLINLKNTIGFTQLFNAAGAPAMSVPLATSTSGLPIGIQFGAALGHDDLLFALAAQLEQARPWFDRRAKLD